MLSIAQSTYMFPCRQLGCLLPELSLQVPVTEWYPAAACDKQPPTWLQGTPKPTPKPTDLVYTSTWQLITLEHTDLPQGLPDHNSKGPDCEYGSLQWRHSGGMQGRYIHHMNSP
jgi:hypothetical protein